LAETGRIFGISPERVRQIEASAVRKLQRPTGKLPEGTTTRRIKMNDQVTTKKGRHKGQMSGLAAAYVILSESEQPLNVPTIAKTAIERGLWAPEGKTPVSTLSAALQTDAKKGEKARFVNEGGGLYSIRRADA
jgi:hypothetical protein